MTSVDTTIDDSLERKLERILTTGEKIEATAPMIYTEKADGVQPAYDIRTDRFEIAQDAKDKIREYTAKKKEEMSRKEEQKPAEPGQQP